jgi:hypothetical protein
MTKQFLGDWDFEIGYFLGLLGGYEEREMSFLRDQRHT